MPNSINAGLPGALASLFALLRLQQQSTSASASQTSPVPPVQPAAPVSAAPESGDGAVRFDFSVPAAQVAPATPEPIAPAQPEAVPPVAPLSEAALYVPPPPLAISHEAVADAPSVSGGHPGAGTAAAPPASLVEGRAETAPAAASEPARLPGPVDLDEEAMARAWALRTITRENTLGLIARMAEQPAPPASAEENAVAPVARPAEPKTLARA